MGRRKSADSVLVDGRLRRAAEVTCPQCKRMFLIRRDWIGKRKYCGQKCRDIARHLQNSSEAVCSGCGSSFRRQNSHMGRSPNGFNFCSRPCKDKAQRLENGNNGMWPGHYGRGSGLYNYRETFSDLLESGCVDCGERREWLLQLHHKDGNRRHNKRENVEAVCNNDHQKRHLKLVDGKWIRDNRVLTPRDVLPLM